MPWMAIAAAASAIGTGVAVAGAVQQGQIAKTTGEYNAKLAEQQAAANDVATRETLQRTQTENQRLLSQQRAQYAGAGLTVDDSTPLQVQAQTAGILQLNAIDEMKTGMARSRSLLGQADAQRLYGQTAQKGANLQAAGSLLGGIGTTARDIYKIQ